MSLLTHATTDSWVVLELGNWMLEGLHTIERSPQVSVFTNLMPDHLDSYDSMEDYGEAKTAIYRYQRPGDLALFNAENDFTARYAAEAPSEQVWLYAPDQGARWPREAPAETVPFRYGDDVRLRGAHNLGNVQAATAVAELLGIAEASIHKTVAAFGGVPHRLEVVRELDGVTWVNDSASTAPIAGVAALRSFHEPVVLIAGGNTKKLDFTEFADEAASRAKKVIILAGTASDAFAAAVREAATTAGKPDLVVGPLPALDLALREARAAAVPGDIVLLSPGFTSFGLFLHEFDRGDKFRAAVLAMS
ncbi:MAG TPA: UDP-N-acetylmuramoyl-L-alanine--D-glutamate ligase, partial [Ktedonobacterales bacterium]